MAFENVDYKSLDIPAAPFSDPSIIPDFPKNKVPRHVGVIMDGNGRWAQQRGLIRTGSSSMGYSLETKDITLSLKHIYTIAQEQNVTLSDVEAEQIPNGHRLNFRVVFSGRHKKKHRQQFFNTLAAAEETLSLTTKDKQTV